MYICICHAINDRQVRQAISAGMLTIRQLRLHFGFRSCCGKCTGCMRELIIRHGQATNGIPQEACHTRREPCHTTTRPGHDHRAVRGG